MVVASIIKEREGDKIGKEEEAIEIEEIEAIEVEEIPDDDVQAIEDEVLMHRKSKQKGQLICDHCIAMFNNSQSLWLHKKKAHRVELSEERKRRRGKKDKGRKGPSIAGGAQRAFRLPPPLFFLI